MKKNDYPRISSNLEHQAKEKILKFPDNHPWELLD
jgi:hypothetical protein